MNDLAKMRDSYIGDGLKHAQAEARTAQDAMLDLIAKSTLSKSITIKGGVLMQHVSKDARRATTDFDLDFVRYPITDSSIRKFVRILSDGASDFSIRVSGEIEELKHQDYSGKRVHVVISDACGNAIKAKIDIGVHHLVSPELEEICFDLGKLEESVTLLADSGEQVVAEKLRSLLRIGAASTRYKDIFDIYYLLCIKGVRASELDQAIRALIFDDEKMRENDYPSIARRLTRILNDRRFRNQLSKAKNDWLEISPSKVTDAIIEYFS
ncbi:nucleotidyl transferase AbiEii/AbiGii toxin family protein [Adlercreutzia sp. ZJ473]|uniref:nucleotidyl transferase AbiEii/AbiGii toxin family protein n=1 Tax=Adlercreutzia sp. ZJ473 TaxID=2722822 RepID=UPI0015540B9D|nr:nucleotidyl transferase AbiEii/AbiGii toxin family protein [Adlercreutzia sp. ZJ473]